MKFRVSVSQMKMFHPGAGGCPRKWALHYLAGIPRQQTEALQDGILSHECLEDLITMKSEQWLAKWPSEFTGHETSLKAHKAAKFAALSVAMFRHLPDGKAPAVAESSYMLQAKAIDTEFYIKPDVTRDRRVFCDWKTTSGKNQKYVFALQQPEFWAPMVEPPKTLLFKNKRKPVRMLRDDIQARLYAYGLMTQWRTREIDARWVYGCKKFQAGQTPKTWIVEHTFRWAETRDWVEEHVWPIARSMNTIRQAWNEKKLDTALLIPHNLDSCEATGHFCDALGACGLTKNPSPIPLKHLKLTVLPS